MASLNFGRLRNQHKEAILHVLIAREADCASNLKAVTPKVNARPPAPSPHTGPKDYAFEMACSNIRLHHLNTFDITHIFERYGPGVTQEVGLDMASLGAKNVGVYTDSTLVKYVFTHFLSFYYDPAAPACHQFSKPLTPSPSIKFHSPSMTRSPFLSMSS